MFSTQNISYAALASIGLGIFAITYILSTAPSEERPEYGTRGLKRLRALQKEGLFKTMEPAIRFVGGWFAQLPIPKVRHRIQQEITHSGEFLGLNANEFLALSFLIMVGSLLIGLLLTHLGGMPPFIAIGMVALGTVGPWMNLTEKTKERFKAIRRSLPTAIDLAALCMSAGLDFPGALRQIVEKSSSKEEFLKEEVLRILQELDLGHTRRKALEGFAERVPVDSVKDFVNSVVQAEAKGTPLAQVLIIQAQMLRMRRSVMAEEAAARAAIYMMGPMMLMFVCFLCLLLGPFIVGFITSGF